MCVCDEGGRGTTPRHLSIRETCWCVRNVEKWFHCRFHYLISVRETQVGSPLQQYFENAQEHRLSCFLSPAILCCTASTQACKHVIKIKPGSRT